MGKRVLLDTNIWSAVSRTDAGLQLRIAARSSDLEILAAPSVLYELARMPEPRSRRRALTLITETHWSRLMPEAFLEMGEVVQAIRNHRPEWLRQPADLTDYRRLEYDWSRRNKPAKRRLRTPRKAGTWERFRMAPDWAGEDLVRAEGGYLEYARMQVKAARQEMISQEVSEAGPLSGYMSKFMFARPGWPDTDITFESWRGDAMDSLLLHLKRGTGAYVDWLRPFVEFRSITPTSWANFWLTEVTATEVPRQWVRWAFSHLQRFRSPSAGTPCDAQLSAYLMDADQFISADKQMVELATECRRYAPVPLATAHRVSGGSDTVVSLFDALKRL